MLTESLWDSQKVSDAVDQARLKENELIQAWIVDAHCALVPDQYRVIPLLFPEVRVPRNIIQGQTETLLFFFIQKIQLS